MTMLPTMYLPAGTETSPPCLEAAAASRAFWNAAVSLVLPSPVAPIARTSNVAGGDEDLFIDVQDATVSNRAKSGGSFAAIFMGGGMVANAAEATQDFK